MPVVSTYYKYLILVFSEAIIITFAFFTVSFINTYGLVFGAIVLLIFAGLGYKILSIFLFQGLPEYGFEEAVEEEAFARYGSRMVKNVIVENPDNGIVWFNEKGYLVKTQLNCFFFYGYPFIFGKRRLIINDLSEAEIVANPLHIDSRTPPAIFPNGDKYIATASEHLVKGSSGGWFDMKQYGAALDIASSTGKLVKEAVSMNPKLLKSKMGDVPLESLSREKQ